MTIRIVTDSTADLPETVVAQWGITVVPAYVNVGGRSYMDGVELSRSEFYELLPGLESPPTTSAPGPGTFARVYERVAAEGATEVLSIHIAASLSNIVEVALMAAQATTVVPVRVIDSGQLTLGTGLLVVAAARAAAAGRSAADIVTLLDDMAPRVHSFAALDTIEFLRRSGRVSRLQYGLGSLLRIKPILKMHNGAIEMERVRTRARAVERLIELVGELGPLEQLALVHTHALERVQALRQETRHLFPTEDAPLCEEVTPVIGAHVGPGAVGFVAVRAR
jgi:DegV family protein with EDD domain